MRKLLIPLFAWLSLAVGAHAQTGFGDIPAFSMLCNPNGVPAPPIPCSATTADPPLLISSGHLLIDNLINGTETFFGIGTGNFTLSGLNNTGIGAGVAALLTTGAQNVLVGTGSGSHLTSSSNNVAFGYAALSTLQDGGFNIAIGTQSLQTLNSHFENVAIGYNSLKDLTSGDGNTCIGYQCGGGVTTGGFNTFIGALNCVCTPGVTTGSNNVVIGGVTGLSSSLSGAIIWADGAGNIRADYGKTTSTWTLAATTNITGALIASTTLQATTKYSAAGTALPTCNAAAEGTRAAVSDATGPTFLATYVSGGTVHAPVYCNGTNWVTS